MKLIYEFEENLRIFEYSFLSNWDLSLSFWCANKRIIFALIKRRCSINIHSGNIVSFFEVNWCTSLLLFSFTLSTLNTFKLTSCFLASFLLNLEGEDFFKEMHLFLSLQITCQIKIQSLLFVIVGVLISLSKRSRWISIKSSLWSSNLVLQAWRALLINSIHASPLVLSVRFTCTLFLDTLLPQNQGITWLIH